MRVVVVGGGGREHALAHTLARSADVVVTPGNPGIEAVATCTPAPPEELDGDLFVVGPEAPIVDGLPDRLRAQGKAVFAPGGEGARLEGSKAWMKEVVAAAGVPTARYGAFTDEAAALDFLRSLPGLYVVKTDGLAAGKGVLVTTSLAEAEEDVREKLAGIRFAGAGSTVVIEEGMTGPELSVLAVCNGIDAVALAPARDHKRLLDGDQGPNTGGMGAYSPVPEAEGDLLYDVMERFVRPTLHELQRRGIDYRGVLYAGLMLTPEGPKLVEYNVRFGDPEAQVVLPRLAPGEDLAALLLAAAEGKPLDTPSFTGDAAIAVVASLEGAAPTEANPIRGLAEAEAVEGVVVFHARTARDPATGDVVTNGTGRIVAVTAVGGALTDARARAYDAIGKIGFGGIHYRNDIAKEAAQQ